jgi:hypothetical protein
VAYEDPASRNARTEVVEGLVRADNPAQQSGADLPKGTGAVINPTQREVRVVQLLAAPNLDALPGEVSKPQALWPMPVLQGAEAFRVQVASDPQFAQIVRDLRVTTASVDLSSLDNATWYARVRGIDSPGSGGLRREPTHRGQNAAAAASACSMARRERDAEPAEWRKPPVVGTRNGQRATCHGRRLHD